MDAPSPGDAAPGLEFEERLRQIVERAESMMTSQARLRELVRVNNDLTSHLDLPTVLRRIVETGVDLIQARYGAMGVIGDGRRLEQFIHVGMDEATVAGIDHLPEGKGLLGALIDDPRPVRLAQIAGDARSIGFPDHHPPMASFIGVPIRVRDRVFGNLYLTDSTNGRFSADDEELAQALAATAGIAIDNARLFEDVEYRARWSATLVEVSRQLMSAEEGDELDFLLDRLGDLARADSVLVAVGDGPDGALVVDHAAGPGAADIEARVLAGEVLLAEPLRSGEPAVVDDVDGPDPLGHAMVVPFSSGGTTAGVLVVVRSCAGDSFESRDLDVGASFAGLVSLALQRSEARTTRRRMALLEDRSRIARDLHDHVIQRLFGTGLNLQAVATTADEATAARIVEQIREIDGAITQIRQSIFAISHGSDGTSPGVRARVLEVVDRGGGRLPTRPRVTFAGPVDLVTDAVLTDDVSAAVTEGLANAVRHAEATAVQITVSTSEGRMSVEIVDDGVGPGDLRGLSGLANLRARAEARDGTLHVAAAPGGGTRLVWDVPV